MFRIFLLTSLLWGKAFQLEDIKFFQEDDQSKLVLTFDRKGIRAKKFHLIKNKQILLDLKNVKANKRLLRGFDTSEFSGSVVYISPYQRKGIHIRMAIQLRDNVRSLLSSEGSTLTLAIENRFGVFTQKKLSRKGAEEDLIKKGRGGRRKLHIPKSESIVDILQNITLSGPKKYIGKRISFNVKDITYTDLLKMIADASGFNIILSDDVTALPSLTMNLNNIPWDHALDTVLRLGKLVAEKNGSILTIATLDQATKEAGRLAEAKAVDRKNIPLLTKIFRISFSKLDEISKLLEPYLSKDRGEISSDQRTNSLIIKDTADQLDEMAKIIKYLDTQTPQVLIEAKIVEAKEDYAKEIGLKNGFGAGYDPVGTGVNEGPGLSFSTISNATEGLGVFGLNIKRFKRLTNLAFSLQLLESESKIKILSSPKIITENNNEAIISRTDSVAYKTSKTVDGVATPEYGSIDAVLELKVTPHVTNEGSIVMDVSLKKDDLGTRVQEDYPPNTTQSSMKTKVLVDNGSTIVIGGIYKVTHSEGHSGIPFLKDLPVVGWLFRTLYNPKDEKSELIIFITPRVINQEEAGLTNDDIT